MHMSEAFPRTYAALAEALDSLGFRARDAFLVEMLVAELKQWAAAEEELEHAGDGTLRHIFQGDETYRAVTRILRGNCPITCALAETLLGRHRDEPSDPRFLA